MPPKYQSHKGKASSGSSGDVSEKVRELKLRQQNWMKQRADAQGNSPVRDSYCERKSSTPVKPKTSHATPPRENLGKPRTIKQLNEQVKPPAKFKEWLKHKNKENPREEEENEGPAVYKPDMYAENSAPEEIISSLSLDSSSKTSSQSLLSADQFDSLADAIANKVRNELKVGTSPAKSASLPQRPSPSEENTTHHSYSSTGLSSGYRETSSPSRHNHHCPDCSCVMLPPNHIPYMVIPCGHTLCQACLAQCDMCPSCDCEISDSTVNSTLQKLIMDVNSQRQQASRRNEEYSRTLNGEAERDYREEYQSLHIRCEVLQAEAEDLRKDSRNLNDQLHTCDRQVAGIVQKEESLMAQIQQLQSDLGTLQRHRIEYEGQRSQLQAKKEQNNKKLTMVKDTLASLQKQAEKMKLLAGID